MNNTFYIGFDADTDKSGCVLVHRQRILKADDIEKAYLESWLISVRQLAGDAPVIARIEMPTKSTAIGCGAKLPAKMHISFGFDCGRCREVAELMLELCRRPHINFTVEPVLSDYRIRCDHVAIAYQKTRATFILALEAARGKKWGNGKTTKTYPSKWTKTQASLIFPDVKTVKISKDGLDALGLLYDLIF